MGAFERCACATLWTICESTVADPTCSERISKAALVLSVAPMSLSPTRLVTGSGSPVSIESLDMPGMTMVFRVADPKMLDGLKEGDKLRFSADSVQGAITVTAIERVQ